MPKILEKMKNSIHYILFFFPAVLGFYGYMQLGAGTALDCAYKTLQLYVVEFALEGEMTNWAVEIARWTAPLATAAALLSALCSMWESFKVYVKAQWGAIAVHGDNPNTEYVVKTLGSRGIYSDKEVAFKAKKHILMFNEDMDMYHFLQSHGDVLDDASKDIYICSETARQGKCSLNNNINVYNIVDRCARNYWNSYPISKKDEKILILGFDAYGQELLTQAIMKNVIATDSAIEYHIGGEYHSYLSKHRMMHKAVHIHTVSEHGVAKEYRSYEPVSGNHDKVFFYDLPWYDILNLGIAFDRMILIHDTDIENLELLNEIKSYFDHPNYHIRFKDWWILEKLWNLEQEQITVFGKNEEIYHIDNILDRNPLDYCEKIEHARYFTSFFCENESCKIKKNHGSLPLQTCAGCEYLHKNMKKQRYSDHQANIAYVDHILEKFRLLLGKTFAEKDLLDKTLAGKVEEAYERLTAEEKYNLWKIEHIRWCRFHFMNNWDYDEKRDKNSRKHNMLMPYEELDMRYQMINEEAYLGLKDYVVNMDDFRKS